MCNEEDIQCIAIDLPHRLVKTMPTAAAKNLAHLVSDSYLCVWLLDYLHPFGSNLIALLDPIVEHNTDEFQTVNEGEKSAESNGVE